jgi:hypothetical protein
LGWRRRRDGINGNGANSSSREFSQLLERRSSHIVGVVGTGRHHSLSLCGDEIGVERGLKFAYEGVCWLLLFEIDDLLQ